jgi:hypothetical protein
MAYTASAPCHGDVDEAGLRCEVAGFVKLQITQPHVLFRVRADVRYPGDVPQAEFEIIRAGDQEEFVEEGVVQAVQVAVGDVQGDVGVSLDFDERRSRGRSIPGPARVRGDGDMKSDVLELWVRNDARAKALEEVVEPCDGAVKGG